MSVDEKSEGAEPWRATAPSIETGSLPDLSGPIIPGLGENCNFEASRFLNFIAENEQFTFQTLDDRKDRSDGRLTHVLHGSLEQHLPRLTELNAHGAGVFFTVNGTDLKGRGTANITKVRAFFVDLDGSPLEPILTAPLRPHIVVQTSPGRFHAYWLVQNARLEDFSSVQKAMIRTFHADPSVHDLPRLMRLPGFNHCKAEPFSVRVVERQDAPPYEAEEFLSAFGINPHGLQMSEEPVQKPCDRILLAMKQRGLIRRPCPGKNGVWEVLCPNREAHTTGDGGTVYFEAGTNGYRGAGFKCQHAHCADLDIEYLRSYLDEDEKWPDPLSLDEEALSVAPFLPDMLPEAISPWLADIADRMQVPLDFLASSVVVILGSLIGRRSGIYPKAFDDWLVVPNLWGAVVGRPSLLKSPAIAEVMKPLEELVAKAIAGHEIELAQYELNEEWYQAKKCAQKDSMRKAAKGKDPKRPSTVEELSKAVKPRVKRYKTEDGTVEKIGEILQENPRGILVHRDELVGWLKSLDKYGREGDRAFYLESWNGTGSYTVDRIGRGTIHIPALCISIIGGIQPGPLAAYVREASSGGSGDDGLLQRFQLLVWPNVPKTWEKVDREPDQTARAVAFDVFGKIDAFAPFGPEDDHDCKVFALRFDAEAQVGFDEWRAALEQKLRSGDISPSMESHLAKYRSLMPKLALIFYIVETVGRGEVPVAVDLRAAQKAIQWCTYLETHATRLYASGRASVLESGRALLRHIRAGHLRDGFSIREVYYGRHWAGLETSDQVAGAIKVLEEFGWVRNEVVKTPGRPSSRIRVHPSIRAP